MASTHTEIYRPFDGELRERPLRWLPLFQSQVRVWSRAKLPLLVLYAPPAIAGIILSFVVYSRFQLEAQTGPGLIDGDMDAGTAIAVSMATAMVETLLEVRNLIMQANMWTQLGALLAVAWFGGGLIAEDRRLGAHLLYFSRPMTRLDYFIGHFLTVGWFGLLAVLTPGLLVCLVASFSSPDFAFVKEEWDVILATIGYALVSVVLFTSIALAVSCLVGRKSFALVGIVGLFAGSELSAQVLGELIDPRMQLIGLGQNVVRIGDWMFSGQLNFEGDPVHSAYVAGGWVALSLAVIWWRLRRLEAVG
jgi:hypothetical protein